MKGLLFIILVTLCPTWTAKNCLDDLSWNQCVDRCETQMDQCLGPSPYSESLGDKCSNTEADCVLGCPN